MKKDKKKKQINYMVILLGIMLIGLIAIIPISTNQLEEIWFYTWLNEPVKDNKQDKKKNNKNDNAINDTSIYLMNLSDKKTDSQTINLLDTLSLQTNIKEKIAPGVKGAFTIEVKAKEQLNYQLKFISLTNKPQNLMFQESKTGKKGYELQELEPVLAGNLKKGESKAYTIQWIWEYETNKENDKQDTKDGKELKNYQFEIKAIVKEIIKE
jgi:hypothetical protein